jgi:hypothetical protein
MTSLHGADIIKSFRLLLGANNLFTVVNPSEREAAEKAGITYHKFTFHDAMAEIQHLGSADDAKKGIVPKELSILEPI